MIDIYDSETLIKIYRMLNKKCEAIDKFVYNHAVYFGPCNSEYGSIDVCNNIIDLIARKNQLINLKFIIDDAITKLSEKDQQILFIKMKYSISMEELCAVLEMKERTGFRRITHAFESLANVLNNSKYLDKLIKIMDNEIWISNIRDDIKDRRMSYKTTSAMV